MRDSLHKITPIRFETERKGGCRMKRHSKRMHKAVATTALLATLAGPCAPMVYADATSKLSSGVQVKEILETPVPPESGSSVDLAKQARSAVLMDATTGKLLYAKDAHERLPMASITKIMTLLLIFEAIDSGKLKWTDSVKVSEHAASMGGSQIFLEPEESMTVRDMVKGIAVASANDACVAMAEHLDGSEESFVARMNERAKQLGMTDTH